MARQRLIDDTASQVCWKYLHGEYDGKTNVTIYGIAHKHIDHLLAVTMIYEIAYRIGYARSHLADVMSETTYKKKKKAIRENIKQMERSGNEP